MPNIFDITVDESVFATPGAKCSEDDIDAYAMNLLKLQNFLKKGIVNIYMTDSVYDSIANKSRYSDERIRVFFDSQRKCKYSSRDIMSAFRYIKSCISSFEDNFNIHSISVDGKVKLAPRIEEIVPTNKRQRELEQNVLMIAVLRKSSRKDSGHLLAFVCESIWKINVEAKISLVKCKGSKIFDLPYSPDVFVGEVKVINDLGFLEAMEGGMDLYDIESGNEDEQGMRKFAFQ